METNRAHLVVKIYEFSRDGRSAKIHFRLTPLKEWLFDSCVFDLQSRRVQYNFEDWGFLKDLASEIQRIQEELKPKEKK